MKILCKILDNTKNTPYLCFNKNQKLLTMTNKHEILADGYLLAVTEYKGKLLDFAIYFQPSEEVEDNEWHEVCPPLPFNRSEVEQLLALHIEELQYAEDAIETRNEAAIEFWREQHR